MILPLTGRQYSEKVAENCSAYWKAVGIYTDAEGKAIEMFLDIFQNESFPPGASILFTQSPLGSLTVCSYNCWTRFPFSFLSAFQLMLDSNRHIIISFLVDAWYGNTMLAFLEILPCLLNLRTLVRSTKLYLLVPWCVHCWQCQVQLNIWRNQEMFKLLNRHREKLLRMPIFWFALCTSCIKLAKSKVWLLLAITD